MKKLLLIKLFILIGISTFSQTIYYEDFSNDWKVGTTTYGGISPAQPSDGNWSWINIGSPDNDGGSASSWNDMAFIDGAAVMSSNGSNSSTLAFRWNDVNNGSTSNRVDWYSKSIIGNYTDLELSMVYQIGNGSSANSVWAYYQIDGGSWILFGSSVNKSSASGTFTSALLSCNTSIQIKVEALTRNSNSAYVTIDDIQITGVMALPIELLYFKVEKNDLGNLLKWETASEYNNDYFTIESTKDGIYYDIVSVIPGAGNSNENLYYEFNDYNISKSINYYRLKQTDYDGRFKYSDIISIDNRDNTKHTLVKVTNTLGQEVDPESKGFLLYHYSDGSIIKRFF